MYQVTAKGRTLKELIKAVDDVHKELCLGTATLVNGLTNNMQDNVEIVDDNDSDVQFHPMVANNNIQAVEVGPRLEAAALVLGELDAEGIPWDKRIHTVAKTKVKAGTWKLKKGSDLTVVTQVKTELMLQVQQAANPAPIPPAPAAAPTLPPAVSTAPLAPPVSILPPVAPVGGSNADQTPMSVATLPPAAPVAPQIASGHTLATFIANFPMVVGTLISEKKLTQNYINQLCEYFKVELIWNINDEQKAQTFNQFVELGYIQQVG